MADYNPLEHAITDAQHSNREMGRIFDEWLGNADHPLGRTLVAYRQAREAMSAVYSRGGQLALASKIDVIRSLRLNMQDIINKSLDLAIDLGVESAKTQHKIYKDAGVPMSRLRAAKVDKEQLFDGWFSIVDSQMTQVEALVRTYADPSMIYGDGERTLGLMQPVASNREGARWLMTGFTLAFLFWLFGRRDGWGEWGIGPGEPEIKKQAIAAIDNRTTECCLRVHGQIQPLDRPFRLTGTPRYADRMDWPPFHLWCRTAVALYMDEFDLGLTDDMKKEARHELGRRSP